MMLLCIYFLQYSKFVCLFLFHILLLKLQWCANTQLTHWVCRLLAWLFCTNFSFFIQFQKEMTQEFSQRRQQQQHNRLVWRCVHYKNYFTNPPVNALLFHFMNKLSLSLRKSLKWKHFPPSLSLLFHLFSYKWALSGKFITEDDQKWWKLKMV